jgi:hypothetical protein
MIQESNPDGGIHGDTDQAETSHIVVLPFTAPGLKFRPNGNYIRLAYQKPEKVGSLHIPGQAKPMDFIVATALDVGPDCKFVKPSDRVMVATKGIIGGVEGVTVEGTRTFWTQENLCVTVIEAFSTKAED